MSKNITRLSARQGIENNLFAQLGNSASEEEGRAPEDLEALARKFLLGKANIHGARSSYDLLVPDNAGKKVYVCDGAACLCAGARPQLIRELKRHFQEREIGTMRCLGRCYENAAFQYKGRNYSARTPQEIADIVESGQSAKSSVPFVIQDTKNRALKTPILTAQHPGFQEYYASLREAMKRDPRDILREIETSGLRGRGGAWYPVAMKWKLARDTNSEHKFIIGNGDEGDPGAYSDRYLLEQRPYAILFGMMIGAYCIGAKWGILYIRAEYPESVAAMEKAIGELRANNLIGKNIDGRGLDLDFKILKGQGSYLCGEETALIRSIEGQRPEPAIRPPFPAQRGLFDEPTVVNNVETLATIPFIVENGGNAYRNVGTERSSGTKLVCADGRFNRPGIHEVEMGTSLSLIVHELAGGFREPVKALHIGGPLGGLVPISLLDGLTLDFESFSEHGLSLGHASLLSIPERVSILEYITHLFSFATRESCGKCFPCRLGIHRGYEMFKKTKEERHEEEGYKIDATLLDDLLHTMETGSLCGYGSGIALPLRNALHHFKEELVEYIPGLSS
uniref:NADH-quinone oxidoreductase subunit F n=1 Tax=Candidatus Kentrum sp. TC TaxID=2126339 RepID=A0A450YEW0_9GAMM|nr:MAG: NADH-quinone oxidoreductase subunit F [Candidatus Kentron sp. TC]VFK55927.1 MAG: NADH-quinone oxidoreductase subunit F [Candidatus Kentron sp. TC]